MNLYSVSARRRVCSLSTVHQKIIIKGMIEKFDKLISNKNLPYTISDLLPKVLVAGENAGTLSEEGAKLLDTTGKLGAGIPLCPPEVAPVRV